MEASGQEHQADELSWMLAEKQPPDPENMRVSIEQDGGKHIYPPWTELADIAQRAAEMTPVGAMKIARGLMNYGRAEIRIPLHNLFGLFDGKNVEIVHIEYDIRAEQLCFIVEGDGLPRHPEGTRPFVVPGRFTGGSYIMADVRGEGALDERTQ